MARRKTTGKFSSRKELIDQVVHFTSEGQTYEQISKRVGVSIATVANIFHDSGAHRWSLMD